ncbi:metallopeptidase, family M24 [Clostridium sporogenes]|nr:metallopeptidase, family M24 [Clostridium sporogenes]NFL78779.1 metallopeptidase, family M24 [Clostridium sporogenes]NFQ67803.1 metallopeptidase, family M24 [Clostridium sporogenes]NFT03785.1 metallopeptidase, family M24 [Clostridium sporogenes]NFT32851.1 metallopeptidase, family M24 [Clostridium sporogenes]
MNWQYRPKETHHFEEGIVITDEPGIYIAGSHEIRIGNKLIVYKGENNS